MYALLDAHDFAGDHALGGSIPRSVLALDAASAKGLRAALARVLESLREAGDLALAQSFAVWWPGMLAPRFGDSLPSLESSMKEPTMLAETLTLAANPFVPGMGIAPPYLAGREREQSELLAGLERLRTRQPVGGLILSAPRGVGKTVLLDWLAAAAEPTEVNLHNLNANQIPNVAALTEALSPGQRPDAALSLGVHAEVAGASAGFDLARTPASSEQPPSYELLLASKLENLAQTVPQLLMVDEAHTLAPEVLRALCNQSQAMARAKLPCWLILAGTPGLMPFLMSEEVGSSFVERAKAMHPGLLSKEASGEALLRPLAQHGWTLPAAGAATLQGVVDDSQGYPFFVQLWGKALWSAAVARGERVWDDALVEAAHSDVDLRRASFYDGRYRELNTRVGRLDGRQVRTGAERAADALLAAGADGLAGQAFEAALGLDADACEVLTAHFEKVGFIVRQRGRWLPGIPSLAQYMAEQSRA